MNNELQGMQKEGAFYPCIQVESFRKTIQTFSHVSMCYEYYNS